MNQAICRIGVDIDSVLADILPRWIALYNEDYFDNLEVSAITQWEVHLFVKPECGKKVYNYLARPDFYEEVKPIAGAIEGITKLQELGYQIYYVSSCVPETMDQKVRWMYKYIPNFSWEQICFCHDKALIDVDCLVDDGPHNLDAMPGWVATVRYAHPYNEQTKAHAHVSNWETMNEAVDKALWNICNKQSRYKQTDLVVFNQ